MTASSMGRVEVREDGKLKMGMAVTTKVGTAQPDKSSSCGKKAWTLEFWTLGASPGLVPALPWNVGSRIMSA